MMEVGPLVASQSGTLSLPNLPKPTDVQRSVLMQLKSVALGLKALPASILIHSHHAINGMLWLVQSSGYPIEHFEEALCKFSSLSEKYSSLSCKDAFEFVCEAHESACANVRDRLIKAYVNIEERKYALTTASSHLQELKAKEMHIGANIADLKKTLKQLKERYASVCSKIGPLSPQIASDSCVVNDMSKQINEWEHEEKTISAEYQQALANLASCELKKTEELARINAEIHNYIFTFEALFDWFYGSFYFTSQNIEE